MKKILSILLVMLIGAVSAMAANGYTRAGKHIANYGTLSYTVGNDVQDDINSTTDEFVVDRKVNLVVARKKSSYEIVNPGQQSVTVSFTVRNEGNDVQDFNLTAIASETDPFGGTDNIDFTFVKMVVDKTGDGYTGDDDETFIDELEPDHNKTVFIVYNVPSTAVDGDIAKYSLLVEVRKGGTGGQGGVLTSNNADADDKNGTVQNIFADSDSTVAGDGDKDAKHGDPHAFKVMSAVLNFMKWSIVTKDPVDGTSNPKRIPGATIFYCFELNNTGTVEATKIHWTDAIDVNMTIIDAGTIIAQAENRRCDNNCSTLTGGGTSNGKSGQDVRVPGSGDFSLDVNNSVCAWIETEIN